MGLFLLTFTLTVKTSIQKLVKEKKIQVNREEKERGGSDCDK